jgi:hypothetical protein
MPLGSEPKGNPSNKEAICDSGRYLLATCRVSRSARGAVSADRPCTHTRNAARQTFGDVLALVVDPSLLENDELYFNAARLDRSMVLKTRDYVELAKPRLERIAAPG